MCHGTEGPGRLAGPKLARNIADIAEAEASFIIHPTMQADRHDEHESTVAPNGEPQEAQKIPLHVSDVLGCLAMLCM